MPQLQSVRLMGSRWTEFVVTVRQRMLSVPDEGMSFVAFRETAMREVSPSDALQLAHVLHRQRVLWLSKGASPRVYRERPYNGRGRPPKGLLPRAPFTFPEPVERFLADVHPRFITIKLAMAHTAPQLASRAEAIDAIRGACESIAETWREHASRGTPPAVMREAIQFDQPADAVARLMRERPELGRDRASETGAPATTPKRQPSGLPPADRAYRYIVAAGPGGISHSALRARFANRLSTTEIAAALEGAIEAEKVLVRPIRNAKGREIGQRYVAA